MPTGYTVPTVTARQAAGVAGQGRLVVAAPVIVDRQTRPFFANAIGGQAAVALGAPAQGYAFQVEILDLWSDSTDASTAGIFLDSAAPQNELDYSANAGHDIAFENPPLYVPSGSSLLVVWSGLSAGAQCTARIQYSVLRFVPVSYGG